MPPFFASSCSSLVMLLVKQPPGTVPTCCPAPPSVGLAALGRERRRCGWLWVGREGVTGVCSTKCLLTGARDTRSRLPGARRNPARVSPWGGGSVFLPSSRHGGTPEQNGRITQAGGGGSAGAASGGARGRSASSTRASAAACFSPASLSTGFLFLL